MIFKPELSPQNFHYDVLYPLYSGCNECPEFAQQENGTLLRKVNGSCSFCKGPRTNTLKSVKVQRHKS